MLIITIIFGFLFMVAGLSHIVNPKFFEHFIPNIFPKLTVNYIVGFIEFVLGLGLFFPTITSYASLGIFIIMFLFLPIHVLDATKKKPAIGSKFIAYIRILLQFLFLYGAYSIYQNS